MKITSLQFHTLLVTAVIFSLIIAPMEVHGGGQGTINKARSQCASVEQEIIDFETLEQQVKDTKAVGVMTKLKLSNDINKLLSDLKEYQAGNSPLTLEQHREQYDLLYMKIVTLVQEKDPKLYHELCNAWDPIWAELQGEQNKQTASREHLPGNSMISWLAGAFMTIFSAMIPTASAEEQLSHEDVVKRDLFVVITLHGVHCEEVVAYEKIDNQDYVATCKNGNRYRVQVTADGSVNMLPQGQ